MGYSPWGRKELDMTERTTLRDFNRKKKKMTTLSLSS